MHALKLTQAAGNGSMTARLQTCWAIQLVVHLLLLPPFTLGALQRAAPLVRCDSVQLANSECKKCRL